MAIEDFTTYTEIDPNSHITVTTDKVTHDAYSDEDAYLYDDKGVDHFGSNLEHLLTVFNDGGPNNINKAYWMLSNDLDNSYGLLQNKKTAISMMINTYTGSPNVRYFAREFYDGSNYQDFYSGDLDTIYYLTVKKSSTTFTIKIYSDSARTTLLDTLSLTLHGDWSFRYVFGTNSWNTGANQEQLGYTEDLDLQEGNNSGFMDCNKYWNG